MDDRPRTYLAELFGTFLVVLIGAGTVCSTYLPEAQRAVSLWGVPLSAAVAEGVALGLAISLTAHLSIGCCNPAITLALFVTQQLDRRRAVLLVLVQLIGAFLAGLVLRSVYAGQTQLLTDARLGCPHLKTALTGPAGEVTLAAVANGVVVELLGTALLTVVAFATLTGRRGRWLSGAGMGLAQTANILFAFYLTGGAANPARWFGPATWQFSLGLPPGYRPLADHPVYWLGPVLGALAGGIFYVTVIAPPEKR